MIEILERTIPDFEPVVNFESWKVAYLSYSERFSKFEVIERHLLTDEVFVLLEGKATLFVAKDGHRVQEIEMERQKVYNVKKAVWHHIVVSKDANVLVVENSNTCAENSEILPLSEYQKRIKNM